MKTKIPSNPREIIDELMARASVLQRYSYLIFGVFVACVYGYVLISAQSLRNAEPSEDSVSSQVQAANVPHIDENIVKQLQSLKDNSVSVQTLFDEARNNPFE